MTDRFALSAAFLTKSGWAAAERRFLAGDASARQYDRLRGAAGTAVLMDASPERGEDVAAFMRIARHLQSIGLSAPTLLAADQSNGFLLLEDLGDDLFADLLNRDISREMMLYTAAVAVLERLHAHAPAAGLQDATAQEWAQAAAFAPDWYGSAVRGELQDTAAFQTALGEAISRHADGPRVMILRDYHAENLIWLPDRSGPARVGLLDFQLAQMGQPGYDLVSLCQDARRDVSAVVESSLKANFLQFTGADDQGFSAAYAVLGAQRALRILGVFARLSLVSSKPGYIEKIPRVWGHLQRNLQHPALASVAPLCKALLPPPTPTYLERIRSLCGTHAGS